MATKDEMKGKLLAALLAKQATNALHKPPSPLMNALMQRYSKTPVPNEAQIQPQPTALDAMLPFPRVQTEYLRPDQEIAYRAWMRAIGHTREAGFAVRPDFSGENYDYRGFFKKYGPVRLGQGQHLTDEFKLPSHPTFSNESVHATGRALDYAGSWKGEVYTPSPAQFVRGKRRFLSQ
jgi:hypothetical protein